MKRYTSVLKPAGDKIACPTGGLMVAAVFFAAAVALSGKLPLWLDEIIQLRETRNTSPAALMASLPGQPGAAPLGYLSQQAVLRATGYSVRSARFPSAVFAAGTVFLVAVLGAELGLATPWIASAFFALFPVTLRYACESRVYSQALFFSTLGTVLFVRLVKKPTWLTTGAYGLAMTAAVYTQPYAVFMGIAHILWAVVYRERKAAIRSTLAIALTVLAFLPWYFRTRANWSSGIAGAGVHFTISLKTPLMVFRELAGAGYWGSGLLLILCALAMSARPSVPRPDSRTAGFLLLSIAVPIVLALAADGAFGYFVAARQMMWVLPAVAILAAFAVARRPRAALPVAAMLAVFCLWQSVRFFTAPREDWQLASDTLLKELTPGTCLVVVPPEQQYSYVFFHPELAGSPCPAPRTVVAFTPYADGSRRQAVVSALTAEGYTRQAHYDAGKSEIELFSR